MSVLIVPSQAFAVSARKKGTLLRSALINRLRSVRSVRRKVSQFNFIATKTELISFQGHKALDCKGNRLLDWSKVADKTPDDAWEGMKVADGDRDLDDLREVCYITILVY